MQLPPADPHPLHSDVHLGAPGSQLEMPKSTTWSWPPRLLRRFHVTPRADLRTALAAAAARIGGETRFPPLFGGYAWAGEIRAGTNVR